MSETNPKILDPVYGSANGRPVELARLARERRNATDYNRARRERIDRCWTCPGMNVHGCDPRHCRKERRE